MSSPITPKPRFQNFNLPQFPAAPLNLKRSWKLFLRELRRTDYMLGGIFLLVSLILSMLAILSTDTAEVSSDSSLQAMAYAVIPLTLMGSLLGFLFLKLGIGRRTFLLLLTLCVLIPIVLGLLLYSFSLLTSYLFMILLVPLGWFAFFLLLKLLKEGYNSVGIPMVSFVVLAVYCVLIPLLSVGVPLYLVVTAEDTDKDFWMNLGYIVSVPLLLSVILPWTLIHLMYFRGEIKEDSSDSLNALLQSYFLQCSPRRQKWINALSSASIICSLIIIEGVLTYLLTEELDKSSLSELFYVLVTLLAIVPLFSIVGMAWTLSSIKKEDKLFYSTVIVGFIPLLITFPIYLSYADQFPTFCLMLLLLPPASAVYWGSLSLVKDSYPVVFKIVAAGGCLLVAIPIGILLPLYDVGYIATYIWTAVFVGLAVLGILGSLTYKLIKFIKLTRVQKKTVLAQWYWYNPTLWISMVTFIGGVGILIWAFGEAEDRDWAIGLIIALLVFLPIAYCATSILLKVQLTETAKLDEDADKFEGLRIRRNKKRIQQWASLFCLIGILLISAGAGLHSFLSTLVLVSVIILGVGLTLLNGFVIASVKGKSLLGKYAKRVTSLVVSCCWCFILIPFTVLLPASLAVSGDEELAVIISTTIGFMAVLAIGGVSFFSIFLNLLLKKMDQEKKAKKSIIALRKNLKKIYIKADPKALRIIFDQFIIFGKESYLQILLDKEVFFWDELEDDDFYMKKILTAKSIKKKKEMKRLKDDTEREPENLQADETHEDVSCWKMLACFEIAEPAPIVHTTEEEEYFDESKTPREMEKEIQEKFDVHTQQYGDIAEVTNSPVPPEELERLKSSEDYLEMFDNPKKRLKWLTVVFSFFSRGFDETTNKFFMGFQDLKEFMRLSGLHSPGPYGLIGIETMYCRATEFDGENPTLLDQKTFLTKFLPTVALVKYRKKNSKEGVICLFKDFLYPNLMYNLKGEFSLKRKNISKNEPPKEQETKQILPSPSLEATRIEPSEPFQETCFSCNLKIEKCMNRISSCIINVVIKIADSLTNLLFSLVSVEPPPAEEEEEAEVVNEEENQEIPLEEENLDKEIVDPFAQRPVPEWDDTVQLIIKTIEEAMTETKEEIFDMECSLTNLAFLGSRVLEYFSMCAIAFRPEVDWGPMSQTAEEGSDAALVEVDSITVPFWSSLGLSLFFLLIIKPALKLKKENRLGKDKNGNPAKFYHLSFWLTRLLNVLGNVLYIQIVKSLLAVFSCDMTVDPWTVRGSAMECYSGIHLLYLGLGTLGFMVYYPLATFNFPDMQFYSFGLDFKFDSTFLVVLSQGKLIIAGVAVFFEYAENLSVQLTVNGCVLVVIIVLNIKTCPCIIQKFNTWNTIGYSISLWAVFIAELIFFFEISTIGFYVFWLGFVALIVAGFVLHIKKFGVPFRNKNKVEPEDDLTPHQKAPPRRRKFSSFVKFFT